MENTSSTTGTPPKGTVCKTLDTKFERRFLRSLLKLKRNTPDYCTTTLPSSSEKIRKRSQRIKLAAYSSMARIVGPRRAWSRAALFKLRTSRACRHQCFDNKKRASCLEWKTKNKTKKTKKRAVMPPKDTVMEKNQQMSKLREIVPGGKDMDICSLFEETAHYIQCLSTQVKVMQAIADRFSSK